MATISGLLALADGMQAYAKNAGSGAVVAVGWKARDYQVNQGAGQANRIVLCPGDPDSGDAGVLTKPRIVGSNPRALAQWSMLVTMYVWAADTSDGADERKQIQAVHDLLELAMQAAHFATTVTDPGAPPQVPATQQAVGVANIVWGKIRWTIDNREMAMGRELAVQFVHNGPIYDVTLGIAKPSPIVNRGTPPFVNPLPNPAP